MYNVEHDLEMFDIVLSNVAFTDDLPSYSMVVAM